ncbi:SGNH hydrolase domain-containing protein [Mesorhizobium sp. WSM4935]|uniref:SGNH hydrolase domain-containing protein n=1 Tax=Mesorhizobium sp. WSM4935 TaxID=3038547 RepID=UPI0024151D82|nr:SGNH hydrolase domain-containing protein [Mesorhizobium sp. WSM4935]MDG4875782.1 SGNH hydrolase domain-containing protein [Mesorhizobium sp. WSM4935]
MPEAVAKAMIAGRSTDVAAPLDYVEKRQALSRAILARLAAKYGAAIIDPLPTICSHGHCNAVRNGLPIYKDADHITATHGKEPELSVYPFAIDDSSVAGDAHPLNI